jgi:hypothetical protein
LSTKNVPTRSTDTPSSEPELKHHCSPRHSMARGVSRHDIACLRSIILYLTTISPKLTIGVSLLSSSSRPRERSHPFSSNNSQPSSFPSMPSYNEYLPQSPRAIQQQYMHDSDGHVIDHRHPLPDRHALSYVVALTAERRGAISLASGENRHRLGSEADEEARRK